MIILNFISLLNNQQKFFLTSFRLLDDCYQQLNKLYENYRYVETFLHF